MAGDLKILERLLTVPEVAEILGLAEGTVRDMTRDGRLRTIKPTGKRAVRIDPKDLQEFIDLNRKVGAEQQR